MAHNATLATLIERRGQLLTEAQNVALKEKTPETRTELETRLKDIETIEKDIAQEQQLVEMRKRVYEPTTPAIRPVIGTGEVENRAAQEKKAFSEWMRFGTTSAEHRSFLLPGSQKLETRDQSRLMYETRDITTIGTGAQFIPQAFDPVLAESLKSYGQIASVVRSLTTDSGAAIKYSGYDPTQVVFAEVTEDTSLTGTGSDPVISGNISNTSVLASNPVLITLAELEDSAFDIDNLVRNMLGKAYWRNVSNFVVNGSSSGNYASLLSGITNTVTSTGPTAFVWNDFTALLGAVDPDYLLNSKFAMNSVTRAQVLGLVDNNGRPLLNINAASIEGVDTLMGRPVIYAQQLPNVAASASGTVVLADFEATYTLRTVRGSYQILRLAERYADKLCVGFIAYARGGGYLNALNGAKAAVKLVQHS